MNTHKYNFTTIKDLEKEFPSDKYFLVESKEKLKSVYSGIMGDFEVVIGSPNHKGEKQPVQYHNWKKYNHINNHLETEIERLKAIMQHNKFTNDLQWNDRAKENMVLDVVIDLDFNKTLFWKHLENAGLVKEDIPVVETILNKYKVILIEKEELQNESRN